MVHLVTKLARDIQAMTESSALPFSQRPQPSCQGAIAAFTMLMKNHPSVFCDAPRVYWSILFYLYRLYKASLSIVADSSICEEKGEDVGSSVYEEKGEDAGSSFYEKGEDAMKDLLSKGPIQPEDSGVVTKEDHIAKDKLDCRGHLIGSADAAEAKRLKELMLSCWLICKHASEGIATLFEITPDACFGSNSSVATEQIVTRLHSYLSDAVLDERLLIKRACVDDHDVLFLLMDLLTSMLTIKHIGGIVYVADAITRLLIRVSKVNQKNTFVAR